MLKYGVFKMPRKLLVQVDEASLEITNDAVFSWAPFERGVAHTIGNSLRRILLSSVESWAVVGVYIEGFLHEFMAMDGIIEDMLRIVLNCKGILVGLVNKDDIEDMEELPEEFFVSTSLTVTQDELDESNGQLAILVGRVFSHEILGVFNPDHHLFSITKPIDRMDISFRIRVGRGFVPVARLGITDRREYEVLLDGVFSPVRSAVYHVEPHRVGMKTDYDKLVMRVITDGRLSANNAVSAAVQVLAHHCVNMTTLVTETIVFTKEDVQTGLRDEEMALASKLLDSIEDMDFGVRAFNCLHETGIEYVIEVLLYSESELLCIKNLGRKSLDEIKARLMEKGLYLGMDISVFNVNRENIKSRVQEIRAELETYYGSKNV